jgi:uncharacterized ParB-like nuclease family protein
MTAAHQQKLAAVTQWDTPTHIPISQIASTGFPLAAYAAVDKVQRMQSKLRRGGQLPPIRVTKLTTPELRDKYGVTDASKMYYLNSGHHRLAAAKLTGRKTVRAAPYDGDKI